VSRPTVSPSTTPGTCTSRIRRRTLWKVAPDGAIEAVADVDDGLAGPSSVALWTDDAGTLVADVSNQAIGDPQTIKHGPSIIAISLD
jgi:hypothetical protein